MGECVPQRLIKLERNDLFLFFFGVGVGGSWTDTGTAEAAVAASEVDRELRPVEAEVVEVAHPLHQ